MSETVGDEISVPTLDVTINGHPVELPQEFWAAVWKEVAKKMLEEYDHSHHTNP